MESHTVLFLHFEFSNEVRVESRYSNLPIERVKPLCRHNQPTYLQDTGIIDQKVRSYTKSMGQFHSLSLDLVPICSKH